MEGVFNGNYHKVAKIINSEPREKWKELIIPYIEEVDNEDLSCLLDGVWCRFTPEELDPNHKWKYNIGDIVTDGEYIMKITEYPLLDPRRTEKIDTTYLQCYGNTYHVIKLDDNGNEYIDKFDPLYELHLEFNEKEIWRVE